MNNQKHNEPNRKTCQLPLDLLMIRSRQGDDTATEAFCQWAAPIVRQFCAIPYFVKNLGRGEIQSLLNLTLTEFLMEYPDIPSETEIPRLLRKVMKNVLLNQIQKEKIRSKYHHQQPGFQKEESESGEDGTAMDQCIADNALQPEHVLLQQELTHTVKSALNQLRSAEQRVLYALYFEQRNTSDLAKELHCCIRNIRRLHKQGLKHLRKIFMSLTPNPAL